MTVGVGVTVGVRVSVGVVVGVAVGFGVDVGSRVGVSVGSGADVVVGVGVARTDVTVGDAVGGCAAPTGVTGVALTGIWAAAANIGIRSHSPRLPSFASCCIFRSASRYRVFG